MNYDLLTTFVFIILLAIFLWFKRSKLDYQKMLFPFIYGFLYRTKLGLKLMDKTSRRFRQPIILLGYIFTGVAWVGLIYASIIVLISMLRFLLAPSASEAGVALLLPSTNVPGIGYLSFWYWIICIFILAIIHEFSHGIVARAYNVRVKSSGFAFFAIILPIFPAAFVEPDEKKMSKRPDIEQYSVLAAGPMSNIVLAILIAIAFPFVTTANGQGLGPYEETFTEPIGFSVNPVNETLPAASAGITNGTIITSYNGEQINDSLQVIQDLYYCVEPGQTITMGDGNNIYTITTTSHPDDRSKSYVGIRDIQNERRVKPGYEAAAGVYYWFKGLFRWLFLLNVFIGLANLLPLYMTDGARMLLIAMQKIMKDKKKAQKIWGSINAVFLTLLLVGILITYIKRWGFF